MGHRMDNTQLAVDRFNDDKDVLGKDKDYQSEEDVSKATSKSGKKSAMTYKSDLGTSASISRGPKDTDAEGFASNLRTHVKTVMQLNTPDNNDGEYLFTKKRPGKEMEIKNISHKRGERFVKKAERKIERFQNQREVERSKSTDTYHGKYDISTKRKTITKRSGEVIHKTKNVWRDNEGKRIKTIKSKSKSSATIAGDGRPEEYAEITTSRYNKKKGNSKRRPKQTRGYYVTPEKTGKAYGWGNKNPLGATKATHKKEKTEVKELKKQYRKI